MKIIQITDTHLSPAKPHFNSNWEPLARWIEGEKPDLVIHTGDLTIDGADSEEDIAFSMSLMRQLSTPMLILPGNHDVGHLPGSFQPVSPERLERWRRTVGPDRFVEDRDNWRLIGLNGLILGSGEAEEKAQFEWLEAALESREGRRVAMFSHKPLFIDAADEGDTGYWSVRPEPRARLLDLIALHDVALFASGHLHRAWVGTHENTALVWAPASSFVVGPMARDMPGERIVGAAVHVLGEEIVSDIVALPELVPFLLDDVLAEVYPHELAGNSVEAAQ